ncbi:MAG: ATP-dependent helicase [Spirochaetaceae bacterium]|jgi:DNA helicase-2/ATP-dependent DNA helicase PcrA|nr:ATP-dependent helicase [Spirochaetaceae bacterium]
MMRDAIPASGHTGLPPYLAALNPEQRTAVLHTGRPLLILAGAGSGKTRVITTKIAYLIREQGLDPRSILAVTFTNRAAREMAGRARLIDERAGDAMLRTFHSFGAWFLRRNGSLGGLNSNFVIYDDDDTLSLLAALMEGAHREEVKQTAYAIARAKDYFLTPQDPELDLIDHRQEFRRDYALYEERLAQIGNVDFGDLIKKPVEILRSHPEVARRFRDRFKVIMVDEYQDSNVAQFELLKELCGPETYLCVVGDDDQSIYRFRGAEVRNILEFPNRFPGTDVVRLERNYRSTAPILAVASSVVGHNEDRLGKTLRSERGNGKTPGLVFLPDQDGEAAFCAELIENSCRAGGKAVYSDWAILYRTNAQSLGFETELLRRRIPYRVVGSLKFYEREEVKDALALLSFLVNPRDEVAFRRVVNKPARGVGAVTVERVVNEAFQSSSAGGESAIGDLAAASRRSMPALSAKARSGLTSFLAAVAAGASALLPDERPPDGSAAPPVDGDDAGPVKNPGAKRTAFRNPDDLSAGEGLSVCVVRLILEAGIAEYHVSHDEIAGNQRIANLQELANAASLYPATRAGLLEFLEHIELDRSMGNAGENGGSDNGVTLITLHNTKGLEFPRVIMTGVEQGVFPRGDKRNGDLEEERRLFYVGVTRAMDELYLTSCAARRMFGRTAPMEPSIFLREADRSFLHVMGHIPYSFIPPDQRSSSGAALSGRAGAKTNRASSDGRWRIGDQVFHDDNGYGEVTEIRESEDGPVVRVHFEAGHEVRFLSASQGSHFTKIKND